MGVDFVLPHFQNLFYRDYPMCGPTQSTKCLVIDLAGYVILSYDVTQSSVIGRHVTEVDAGVSKVLIQNEVMEQKQCSNIELGVIQRTYRIDAEQPAYTGLTSGTECYNFKLIPISGTNAFII
uniref:Uncharacterized protein n=1 Tax=Ciona savignyi TaxID=51511 RepID=H2ZEW8_CIOSA